MVLLRLCESIWYNQRMMFVKKLWSRIILLREGDPFLGEACALNVPNKSHQVEVDAIGSLILHTHPVKSSRLHPLDSAQRFPMLYFTQHPFDRTWCAPTLLQILLKAILLLLFVGVDGSILPVFHIARGRHPLHNFMCILCFSELSRTHRSLSWLIRNAVYHVCSIGQLRIRTTAPALDLSGRRTLISEINMCINQCFVHD